MESEVPIDLSLTTDVDDHGGVDLHIMTDGWEWSTGGADYVAGEGHAHIYVDGELLRMVYKPDHHLEGIAPGERQIRVALSANNHASLTYNGEPIEATAMVNVPGSGGHHEAPVVGVEGLHNTLLVEVTHVPSNVSKTMNLRPAFDDPGSLRGRSHPDLSRSLPVPILRNDRGRADRPDLRLHGRRRQLR